MKRTLLGILSAVTALSALSICAPDARAASNPLGPIPTESLHARPEPPRLSALPPPMPLRASALEIPAVALNERFLSVISATWYLDRDRLEAAEKAGTIEEPMAIFGDADPGNGCGMLIDMGPRLALLDEPPWAEAPEPRITPNWHIEKDGSRVEYDQIARRPGRPAEYEAYRYPIPPLAGWGSVASGYDLDKPDEEQRRGKMNAVGHGGVDLPQEIGTPIRMMRLAYQAGEAEVIFVGKFFGNTVITRHTLREGGSKHDYLVIWAHLDEPAQELWWGKKLRAGELVGFVGNSDSPDFVHLHLEVRRLRTWIDSSKLTPAKAVDRELSVVTDPRNVLPLRAETKRKIPSCRDRMATQHLSAWLGDWKLHTLD
jgi:murein DD-endopeptidase MepM/ murein hydrolase activator NlpD